MSARVFTKVYNSSDACAKAVHHHRWLATHARPLRQPPIRAVTDTTIAFAWIDGRHLGVDGLGMMAALLGDTHATAWKSDLHRARLDTPHPLIQGHDLADYLTPRLAALQSRLDSGHLTDLAIAEKLLHTTATGPAAFYKDSNPRNALITDSGLPYVIDVDDLTLAPFGYDLAKLIVTLTMTYGPLPHTAVSIALNTYNHAAARHSSHLGHTTMTDLLNQAELHRIFTAPYLGRGHYQHPWPPPAPHAPESKT
ncbi:phosphotransferase [Nonomuraea sp. NPDC050404]|uniref:phosphotransferase n=1 Tax=Nonomuraea sp. NPDC050404 TaxID=3155783 RepID=UPI0033CCE119